MRKFTDYSLLFLKGMGMGAADVVPGVSGGTIAFITGIYEELIRSIKSVDFEALRLLLKLKPALFWKKVNGNFLLALFTGILFSVFSLPRRAGRAISLFFYSSYYGFKNIDFKIRLHSLHYCSYSF